MERKTAGEFDQELLNLFDKYVCTETSTGAGSSSGRRSSRWARR